MYLIVLDPWGSYVDGRSIEYKELVEAFAKAKGFTVEETDKEPAIDILNSPIRSWEEKESIVSMKITSLQELKEKFPSKKMKKKK